MPRKAAATLMKSHARTTHPGLPNAKLMARVGEDFPFACPGCGGDIRLIAFITDPGPIRKIITHLGEPLEPPPVSPARGPPTDWGELIQAHDDRNVFQATDRRAARDRYPQPLTPAERQVTGHNKAVRRSNSERLRADAGKTSLQRGKQAFRAKSVREWLGRVGVKTLFIEPGSP